MMVQRKMKAANFFFLKIKLRPKVNETGNLTMQIHAMTVPSRVDQCADTDVHRCSNHNGKHRTLRRSGEK